MKAGCLCLVFVEHGVVGSTAGRIEHGGDGEGAKMPQTETRTATAHQPVVLVERHTTQPLAHLAARAFLRNDTKRLFFKHGF